MNEFCWFVGALYCPHCAAQVNNLLFTSGLQRSYVLSTAVRLLISSIGLIDLQVKELSKSTVYRGASRISQCAVVRTPAAPFLCPVLCLSCPVLSVLIWAQLSEIRQPLPPERSLHQSAGWFNRSDPIRSADSLRRRVVLVSVLCCSVQYGGSNDCESRAARDRTGRGPDGTGHVSGAAQCSVLCCTALSSLLRTAHEISHQHSAHTAVVVAAAVLRRRDETRGSRV